MLFRVSDESTNCATEIEKIHRSGANAWMLRATIRTTTPLLDTGNHSPDGSSAQAAGAEGERLKEAIVDFRPFFAFDQFCDHPRC